MKKIKHMAFDDISPLEIEEKVNAAITDLQKQGYNILNVTSSVTNYPIKGIACIAEIVVYTILYEEYYGAQDLRCRNERQILQ